MIVPILAGLFFSLLGSGILWVVLANPHHAFDAFLFKPLAVLLTLFSFWIANLEFGILAMSSATAAPDCIEAVSVFGHTRCDPQKDPVCVVIHRSGGISLRGNAMMVIGDSLRNYTMTPLSNEALEKFVSCYRHTFGDDAVIVSGLSPKNEK